MSRGNLPSQFVLHRGANKASAGPSPGLWQRMSGGIDSPDGGHGNEFFDDFLNFYPVTLTTVAGQLQPGNGYFMFTDVDATAGFIKPLVGTTGGVIRMSSSTDSADGADHDTVLTCQGNVATQAVISDTAGSDKKLIFEARWKVSSITDAAGSFFMGMTEFGLAATNTPIQASTPQVISDDSAIGFFIGEDDNDALDIVYRKNGSAIKSLFTYGTALVADTYIKTGFVYDPKAEASKRITFYIDGAEQGTYVTATQIASSTSPTFPDAVALVMTAACKGSVDAVPALLDMDWWGFWQEI